jgi:hypothetical protein
MQYVHEIINLKAGCSFQSPNQFHTLAIRHYELGTNQLVLDCYMILQQTQDQYQIIKLTNFTVA